MILMMLVEYAVMPQHSAARTTQDGSKAGMKAAQTPPQRHGNNWRAPSPLAAEQKDNDELYS